MTDELTYWRERGKREQEEEKFAELHATIAAQAARIEELEGTLDQVATESDMIFDRGAQRLARIKDLEAELADKTEKWKIFSQEQSNLMIGMGQEIAAQAAEIEELENLLDIVGRECTHLRAELAAAQRAVAPPVPDWSQAPSWAQWWAVDRTGSSFWHEREPVRMAGQGWLSDGRRTLDSFPAEGWATTLQQRPQGQE